MWATGGTDRQGARRRMDINGIYQSSPDWLKLIFILAPYGTFLASLALWAFVKIRTAPPPEKEARYVTYRVDEEQSPFIGWKE